jgi:hypothetical protein
MDIHTMKPAALLTAIDALVFAPSGLAKSTAIACPESDLAPCVAVAIVAKNNEPAESPDTS